MVAPLRISIPRADGDRLPLQIAGSAGDVKDRADLSSLEARDQPAGLVCRDSDKVNVSARGLRHHVGHDRQVAVGSGADYQPGSAPREVLVGRERGVSELGAVWLGGFFAPFAHDTSVDDDVVPVGLSLDLDRSEPEELHIHHAPPIPATSVHAEGQSRCTQGRVDPLNQIMRGWSNYFKHAVAKHTMSFLENFVWHRVIRWWKKLHRWRWKFTETPKTTNS